MNQGEVKAIVSGSELYHVTIDISTLSKKKWEAIKAACAGQIGSLLDLFQGTLSDGVMAVVSERSTGLFPQNQEIKLHCDCFDWADMCMHVAAVLYGVGARLDDDPKALFLLRGVDHEELIDVSTHLIDETLLNKGIQKRVEDDSSLGELFGIDLGGAATSESLSLDTVNEAPQSERGRRRRKTTTISKKKGATGRATKGKTNIPLPRYYSGFSLKNLRQTLGLTQKEMAKTLEVSVATLSKYEKLGRKKVHFSNANTEKNVNRLWRKNRVSR